VRLAQMEVSTAENVGKRVSAGVSLWGLPQAVQCAYADHALSNQAQYVSKVIQVIHENVDRGFKACGNADTEATINAGDERRNTVMRLLTPKGTRRSLSVSNR